MIQHRSSYARQTGLTVLELGLALVVVVLIVGAMMLSTDVQQRHAQLLEAKMQVVQAGVLRLQKDFPCGATKLSALIRREDAQMNFCGDSNNLDQWRGPYIDTASLYAMNGALDLTPIVPGASMWLEQETVGAETHTLLKVTGLTDEVRNTVISRCGNDCAPYKSLTSNSIVVGTLISRGPRQAQLGNSYDAPPLPNVCRPGNAC